MIALNRTNYSKVPKRLIARDEVSVRVGSTGGLKTQVGRLTDLPHEEMGYAERQDSARLITWNDVVHHIQDRLLISSSIAISLDSMSSVKAAYILSSFINGQA